MLLAAAATAAAAAVGSAGTLDMMLISWYKGAVLL
jgi:hypothetical protein